MKLKKKITVHDLSNKYVIIPEFPRLTSEIFAARVKQTKLANKSDIANFVIKRDSDYNLPGFNKRIHSNKTKYICWK